MKRTTGASKKKAVPHRFDPTVQPRTLRRRGANALRLSFIEPWVREELGGRWRSLPPASQVPTRDTSPSRHYGR